MPDPSPPKVAEAPHQVATAACEEEAGEPLTVDADVPVPDAIDPRELGPWTCCPVGDPWCPCGGAHA